LLVEEVGELAKAIRFDQGLKLSSNDIEHTKSIDSELADCLIYLINLANLADVDLEKALREKEAVNSKKKWQRRRTGR
jgi:NTP pyrophosphatase (non-canonical NTP hydrolase)